MISFIKKNFKFCFCVIWFSFLIISKCELIIQEIELSRKYGELNFKWLNNQIRQCNQHTDEYRDMIELNKLGEQYREACKTLEVVQKNLQ